MMGWTAPHHGCKSPRRQGAVTPKAPKAPKRSAGAAKPADECCTFARLDGALAAWPLAGLDLRDRGDDGAAVIPGRQSAPLEQNLDWPPILGDPVFQDDW